MEKLMLIDGNSIFYRSFYALPLLKSENGYSNAVFGFANILVKAIETLHPTHVAVAFDVSKKTFRNEIYSLYKATRKPMPEELRSQIPVLKEMLTLMGIKYVEKQGIEGDDILGTLSKRFGIETVIVTGDRDCFQLIDDKISICRTLKGVSEVQMMDAKAFETEMGIKPIQVIDLKALAGDSSDNIPGVRGVGEKSAISLLAEFGSVENIYENIDKITGKLKEKLEADKENAFMSKKLATINCNVDVPCTLADLQFSFPFGVNLKEFFEKYQMRTLLRRSDIWKAEVKEQEKTAKCENVLIENIDQLKNVVTEIKQKGVVAFFNNTNENVVEISDGTRNYKVAIEDETFDVLRVIFEDSSCLKIGFDIKKDMHTLQSKKILLCEPYFDASLARHLLDGLTVKDIDAFIFDLGLDENAKGFSLFESRKILIDKMQKSEVLSLYENLELPLVGVLFSMEMQGFTVDKTSLEMFKSKYQQEVNELQKEIFALVGEFNLNSPKQLGEVLFEKLMLPHGKKMSTSVDDLELVRDLHPVVPLVLRYRKVSKFLSTYIYGLEKHIDENSLVHTTFKQTLTGTGRLSSTEPNLQNIPIRGEESKEIRSMFTARPGNVLVDADYSQIELRLLAHLSGEKQLIEAFNSGKDIHTETAVKIFNVPEILVTQDMRRVAKVVNFGVIYGISDFGLASDLGISAKAAKKYINDFYANNPKVEEYMTQIVKQAKETGMVRTILGRIRKMVDITSTNYMVRSRAERAAQNAPLQGSGADIVKLAMLKVSKRLKSENLAAKLIMQIHDELIVDCPRVEEQQVRKILKEEMESAYKLAVPLTVDINSAFRWSESH